MVTGFEPPATLANRSSVVSAARCVALVIAALGGFALRQALVHIQQASDPGAWLLPLVCGGLCIVLGIVVALTSRETLLPRRHLGRRGLAILLLLVYAFVLLPWLSFLIGSVLLVLAVAAIAGSDRGFVMAGGIGLAVAIWALFAYVLLQPLPSPSWQ